MHSTNQHHAQPDPEQTWQPSESLASQNRSRDRSSSGNGRKVLPKEIERPGGHEVYAVIHLSRRSCACIVQLELSGYPPSIKPVGSHKQDQKSERDQCQGHSLEASA